MIDIQFATAEIRRGKKKIEETTGHNNFIAFRDGTTPEIKLF